MGKRPNEQKPKMMTMAPPHTEKYERILPKRLPIPPASVPNSMKTKEKPTTKSTLFISILFLLCEKFERYPMYAGTSGSVHGARNVKKPATRAKKDFAMNDKSKKLPLTHMIFYLFMITRN